MKTAKEFLAEMMTDATNLKAYNPDEWEAFSSQERENYWGARYAYYWKNGFGGLVRETSELLDMPLGQTMQWCLLYNVREIVEALNRGFKVQPPPPPGEPWQE